jgi:hypothetical protein
VLQMRHGSVLTQGTESAQHIAYIGLTGIAESIKMS